MPPSKRLPASESQSGLEPEAKQQRSPTAEDLVPPVQLLQHYENIVPGAAEKLLKSYLDYGEHRRAMQRRAQDAQFELAKEELKLQGRGQLYGFLIALASVVGGFALATYGGQPAYGVILSGGSLAAVVAVFVTGRFTGRRE
ncbi:MAG: DUF2335 domain-containing protein [Bryobacteraceae bacterium]|nr:DUF2335 domain-containing protein [Bryobacteraceae bacterium]